MPAISPNQVEQVSTVTEEIGTKISALEESKARQTDQFDNYADGAAGALAEGSERLSTGTQQLDTCASAFTSSSATVDSTITALERRQRGERGTGQVPSTSLSVSATTPSACAVASPAAAAATLQPAALTPRAGGSKAVNDGGDGSIRSAPLVTGLANMVVSYVRRGAFFLRDLVLKNPAYAGVLTVVVLVIWMRLRGRRRR